MNTIDPFEICDKVVMSDSDVTNGQTDIRGFYKAGEKNGLWTYYNEDGSVKKEAHFRNDNVLEGKELELYLQQRKESKIKSKIE